MNINSNESQEAEQIRWQPIVAKYAKPDLARSLWQVANSLIPYFVLWALMISLVSANIRQQKSS